VAVPLLIDLNVLVWLLMVASGISPTDPAGRELAAWGSNVSSLTLHGQPWRLLTSLFVHGGATHLLLNMISLWLLGLMLEQRVGTWRVLAVYLASGLAASLATVWYHTAGINSTGASGAIFGLYGFMLALLLSKKMVLDKFDRRAMLGLVVYLILSNLISGLTGNIDNIAHLGGLLMGALVAGPAAIFTMPAEAPSSETKEPS
jgi:rhomboid protease GluP